MASERRIRRRSSESGFLDMLPDDLLEKIVLLLPVGSLFCLASTCNKWRDYLLDNDDFARLHLERWRSQNGILYSSSYYAAIVYWPIFDGNTNKIILARLKDCLSRIVNNEGGCFCVLDSCDGLLLMNDDYYNYQKDRLVVCNPLMRSFKLLQLPPTLTRMSTCHWNMVYDASIKRYKIIGITIEKVITSMKGGVIISRGRRVYILELCRSSSESEWKEVCVCDDELGDADFGGGQVIRSVLVDEKGNKTKKKKLYYLITNSQSINNYQSNRQIVRTGLIYIDIETHQVKAVAAVAAACSSMSLLGPGYWVGSSSTGRFYISDSASVRGEFNFFVLEDLHNPIWKRRRIKGWNVDPGGMMILPLAVVQDNDNDEEEKILYLVEGNKIYEYQTVGGLWREVSNYTGLYYTRLYHGFNHRFFSIPHLHSLIRI